jgi:hypothetical protein
MTKPISLHANSSYSIRSVIYTRGGWGGLDFERVEGGEQRKRERERERDLFKWIATYAKIKINLCFLVCLVPNFGIIY